MRFDLVLSEHSFYYGGAAPIGLMLDGREDHVLGWVKRGMNGNSAGPRALQGRGLRVNELSELMNRNFRDNATRVQWGSGGQQWEGNCGASGHWTGTHAVR